MKTELRSATTTDDLIGLGMAGEIGELGRYLGIRIGVAATIALVLIWCLQ